MTGIYKITNPKGKIYIGQSVNCKNRKSAYKNLNCKEQPLIYNSILKHGWENHKFEIIHHSTREELNDLESYYIALYQSFNSKFGLNMQSGGGDYYLSDITKNRIREKLKGRKCSEETRRKISESNMGKKMSIEAKERMRNSANKRWEDPEERKRNGAHSKGRKMSEETRQTCKKHKTPPVFTLIGFSVRVLLGFPTILNMNSFA